ncbi:MAG: HIT family protein [Bacteroidia bacterium]|nr:HIT family protein [Bacteroidia bacterium]
MASIFSKIIQGEIPCHKISETPDYLAFLDIMPLVEGHVLVIPKMEIDYIFDLEAEYFKGLWLFAKSLAPAIEKAVPCKRIGIAVIGLEVPHAHIHLVPLNHIGDINFSKPKLSPGQEELARTAAAIRSYL